MLGPRFHYLFLSISLHFSVNGGWGGKGHGKLQWGNREHGEQSTIVSRC